MPNLKQKVAKGAVWTLMEKVSCQAVGFVVETSEMTHFMSLCGIHVSSQWRNLNLEMEMI